MSALYSALETLHPRDYADVPIDDLSQFLEETLTAAELIVNSVPSPPLPKDDTIPPTKVATSASELVASSARLYPVHPEHEALRKNWGKPLKLSAKDNAMGLSMWKMAANDRHGAWFARRSIHEGLTFDHWKRAMQSEFAESLAVSGGPGSGSIRGIGVDRVLDRKLLGAKGKVEVYQLSAQFPGPTAPRDFVTLLITTDDGLTEKSSEHVADKKTGSSIPRHHVVVSIPVEHADAPPRDGLVRGQYESVEIIRELPKPKTDSPSTANLLGVPELLKGTSQNSAATSTTTLESNATGNATDTPASEKEDWTGNPVEWIMITRSDPGGGIPRFMVERGTPSSIAGDAVKFLDWATHTKQFILDKAGDDIDNISIKSARLETPPINRRISDTHTFEPSQDTDTGIIASLTNVVKGGIDRYAPESVSQGISSFLSNPAANDDDDDDDDNDESTETSSLESFASAEQFTTAPDALPDRLKNGQDSASEVSSIIEGPDASNARLEKQLSKLQSRRTELEKKFAKDKEREKSKAEEKISKEQKDEEKIRRRLEREMKKQEHKHNRELKKLEDKQKSEEKKAEERRKKAVDADATTKIKRELDQTKRMAEVLRQENTIWQQRVGELQRENTKLISRITKLDGGQDLLKEIRNELADENSNSKKRSGSPGSSKSVKSS